MNRSRFFFCTVTILLLAVIFPYCAISQAEIYVDQEGIMRWQKNKSEVKGFGVNYSAPFAHSYRMAVKRGVPITKAIDEDFYHFTRLGFDAYRVHVWDTEISDTLGNLIENDHLRIFDYLVMQAKKRSIKLLTDVTQHCMLRVLKKQVL